MTCIMGTLADNNHSFLIKFNYADCLLWTVSYISIKWLRRNDKFWYFIVHFIKLLKIYKFVTGYHLSDRLVNEPESGKIKRSFLWETKNKNKPNKKKQTKTKTKKKKQRKKYSVNKFALDSQSFHWDLNPT